MNPPWTSEGARVLRLTNEERVHVYEKERPDLQTEEAGL